VSQLEDYLLGKEAEVNGSVIAPISAPTYSDRNTSKTQTIKKTGEQLEQTTPVAGETVQKLPQAKPMKLRVDTTVKEMPTVATEKTSQHYALPSQQRYPLDTQLHVKQAQAYFEEWRPRFAPEHRREFCLNLVKRAGELGMQMPEEIRKYGAAGYADPAEIEAACSMRSGLFKEASHQTALEDLLASRSRLLPEDFAGALGELDKLAGLDEHYDKDLHDPFYSTYGEKRAEEEDTAILVGNDYVSHEDLRRFACSHAGKLADAYGEDFVKEFRKDPVGIVKSLPIDQKKHIARLVSSQLTDATTT
jgi:hypothetical protein